MSNTTKTSLSNPWIIFLVTALGVGMATIDGGIVNVALPILSRDFHATVSTTQWIVSIYLLTLCVLLPLSGYLGDLYTKKRIYLSGFIIFTLGSLCCGLAFSLASLIAFRVLQGIGAAMILANNQALLMTHFPKEKRGRALGVNSMTVAIGSITGPGLGGIIIAAMGWRAIFFINIPLGFLGCYLGYKILPKDTTKPERHFDFLGAIIFALMIISVVLFLENASTWGWLTTPTTILITISIVAFLLLLRLETKAKKPLIDLSLFNNWQFSSGIMVSFFVFMALYANMILLPFYLDRQLHLTPQLIGMIMFIAPICIFVIAPFAGQLTDRYNQAILTGVGTLCMFIGLLAQSFLHSDSSIYQVLLDQIFVGIGCGLFSTPNNYSILNTITTDKLGVAAGISSLTRNMGKICGIAIATSIFTALQRHILTTAIGTPKTNAAFMLGFKGALLASALFAFIAAFLAFNRKKIVASKTI